MKLPERFTEAQVLEAMEKAVRLLSHSFVFGYFDIEDIKQEGRKFCWEALARYDPKGFNEDGTPRRPLENFFYAHCRNRFINFRRDKFRRNDPPCMLCHTGRHREHPDGQTCEKYLSWRRRNAAKANLMRPLGMDGISDEREPNMREESDVEVEAQAEEVMTLIDRRLPVHLRGDYLRIKAGERLPKARRLQVEKAIHEIASEYLPCPDEKLDD